MEMVDAGSGEFFSFFPSFFVKNCSFNFLTTARDLYCLQFFSIVFCLFAKKNLAPYQLVLVKQTAPFPAQLRVFGYLHEFPSHAPGGEIGYIFTFCFSLCVSSDLPNQLPVIPQAVD